MTNRAAVLDEVRQRVSAGASPEESAEALGREHQLDHEARAALWFAARHHAEDPGLVPRRRRARSILQPID